MRNQVIRHPILRKYTIVLVDDMKKWANGKITSETYFQKVGFNGRPLSYILIERNRAIEKYGCCTPSIIGMTIALLGGNIKYSLNPKLALNFAIKEAIKKEQPGPLMLLKKIYESTYNDEFPYITEDLNWYHAYQHDKPGDESDPDEWEDIIDIMDDEIEAELEESTMNETSPDSDLKPAQMDSNSKKRSVRKAPPTDPRKGYTHVAGGENNLYVRGEYPAKVAQKMASRKGADAKLVKNKMKALTRAEKRSSFGNGPKPTDGKKGKVDPNAETQKIVVKVVDDNSEEHKEAEAKRDGVTRKASTSTTEDSGTKTDLNTEYSGSKNKTIDLKVAKDTIKSEEFTRNNSMSDSDFATVNENNWLSDSHRMSLDHSAFEKTAVAKTSLQTLERMINTKFKPGKTSKISHYTDDKIGQGQIKSQAGELMMMTLTSLSDDEVDGFYNDVKEFLVANDDKSILTLDWLEAAKNNRAALHNHMNAKHGEGNWEVHSSGWDTKDEFEAMTGLNYKKDKGYSTDVFFTIKSKTGVELSEVTLKKDMNVFLLSSGLKYFLKIDPSLAGGKLDITTFAADEKTRTNENFSKHMAKLANDHLKSNSTSKEAKEVLRIMKELKIDSITRIRSKLNYNNVTHRRLAHKALEMLAKSAGNRKAKTYIEDVSQSYSEFYENGLNEIIENDKLKKGILKGIKKEFPIKSIASSEEIMALGDQMLDRSTMKLIFGTNNSEEIMENLDVYVGSDGKSFLGYAVGKAGNPIPIAQIRLRSAGMGYAGGIKFDFEMHAGFQKRILEANKSVYGEKDNEQS